MNTILRALGALVLAFCISSNFVESKLPLTKFTDLPLELRWNTFELLDFHSLMRASQVLPQDRDIFEKVFRNTLKNRTFQITDDYAEGSTFVRYDGIRILSIYHKNPSNRDDQKLKQMMTFLQDYGQCITKLDISYKSGENAHIDKMFAEQINKYVAKFVEEIHILPANYLIGKILTNPFSNATVVTLDVSGYGGTPGKVDAAAVHRIFPAVRSLDFGILIFLDGKLKHFPHLERLETPVSYGEDAREEKKKVSWFERLFASGDSTLEQTLKLNRQIKYLNLRCTKQWKDIERLNKILPHLEGLEIKYSYGSATVPLRFPNMKVFKFRGNPRDDRIAFEFEGNLEEIHFEGRAISDYWVDLCMENTKLRKVSSGFGLGRQQFEKIANGLPNLEEFEMKYYYDDIRSLPLIVNFLHSAQQVKKATITQIEETECNELAQQLNEEWENVGNGYLWCGFARREL